jgi:hypothetical protein
VSDLSPLVIIRCKKCGRELGSLDAMPDDWSGSITVLRCRKCVIPSPERLAGVLERQKATGGFALLVEIPLTELRRAAHKAQRQGSAETVQLRPISAARW